MATKIKYPPPREDLQRFKAADRPGFQGELNERIRKAQEEGASAEELRALRTEVSEAITAHCAPCFRCGNPPHGIEQPRGQPSADGHVVTIEYEIGCLHCNRIPAVRAKTHAAAVAEWNSVHRPTGDA